MRAVMKWLSDIDGGFWLTIAFLLFFVWVLAA